MSTFLLISCFWGAIWPFSYFSVVLCYFEARIRVAIACDARLSSKRLLTVSACGQQPLQQQLSAEQPRLADLERQNSAYWQGCVRVPADWPPSENRPDRPQNALNRTRMPKTDRAGGVQFGLPVERVVGGGDHRAQKREPPREGVPGDQVSVHSAPANRGYATAYPWSGGPPVTSAPCRAGDTLRPRKAARQGAGRPTRSQSQQLRRARNRSARERRLHYDAYEDCGGLVTLGSCGDRAAEDGERPPGGGTGLRRTTA
jgi:hypothetical protein